MAFLNNCYKFKFKYAQVSAKDGKTLLADPASIKAVMCCAAACKELNTDVPGLAEWQLPMDESMRDVFEQLALKKADILEAIQQRLDTASEDMRPVAHGKKRHFLERRPL